MEPKDFFRVILRRKRAVITAMLIVVGVAMGASMRKEPTFAASCKVRIEAVGPGGGGQISDDPKKNPTEIWASFQEMTEIIQSSKIAQEVADRFTPPLPFGRVFGHINAVHQADTGIFALTAVDKDAKYTAVLCDAFAEQFIKDRVDGATDKVKKAQAVMQARITEFQSQIEAYDRQIFAAAKRNDGTANRLKYEQEALLNEKSNLLRQIVDLDTALKITLGGGGEIIQHAGLSGFQVGPNHKRDGIMGLIIGLIFGCGIALVREYMDDTVRDKDSAQRDLGLPVLASMPSDRSDDPYAEPDAGSIEAARMLRTNLASQGLGATIRAIVVTSTLAKRRSTTLANLASAIAEAGRTVLVIGADFRNARVHEVFGVGNAVGLTNVIRGQITFDKAIRPVPGQVGVYVMPSGPGVMNPGELLSTEEMGMVIRRARKWADVVLIDAPPVLAAADASVLGTYADGVLLVMSAGQTLRAQATEAKQQLAAAGARLLGAVMFGASDPSARETGKLLALPVRREERGRQELMPYGAPGDDWGGGGGGYEYGGRGGQEYGGNSYDYDDFDDGYGSNGGYPPPRRARATTNGNGRAKKTPRSKNGSGGGRAVAASKPRRPAQRTGGSTNGVARNGNGNGNGAARNGNGASRTGAGRATGHAKANGNGNGNARTNGKTATNGKARKAPARRPTRYDDWR